MLIVPVRSVPNQTLTVQLANQPTQLNIYQKATGLFMDVYVNDALIIGGVLCLAGKAIVRTAYLGFVGDLAFFDTQAPYDSIGASGAIGLFAIGESPIGVDTVTTTNPADPDYTGLGARWPLYYFAPSEITNPLVQ